MTPDEIERGATYLCWTIHGDHLWTVKNIRGSMLTYHTQRRTVGKSMDVTLFAERVIMRIAG